MWHWLRETQYLLEYAALRLVIAVVQRLSESQCLSLARRLGWILFGVLWIHRRQCLWNLQLVFGESLTRSQRTSLALQSFEHLVLTCFELIRWTPQWLAAHVDVEGGADALRHCQEAERHGKGAIMFSAHFGNFHAIPSWAYHAGWNGTMVYRPQNNWRVEQLLMLARQTMWEWKHMVPRSRAGVRECLRTLRQGRSLGLMIDLNANQHPVFVDFFGLQAATPQGPAALALATDAPAILAMSIRQPNGRHRVIFHPPFELIRTGDRKQDTIANTQMFTQAIEPYILAYPEQHLWLHPRWETRPDGSKWRSDTPYEQVAAERNGPARNPTDELLVSALRRHAA